MDKRTNQTLHFYRDKQIQNLRKANIYTPNWKVLLKNTRKGEWIFDPETLQQTTRVLTSYV